MGIGDFDPKTPSKAENEKNNKQATSLFERVLLGKKSSIPRKDIKELNLSNTIKTIAHIIQD